MVIYNSVFLLSSCRWSHRAGGDSAGGCPAISTGRWRAPVEPVRPVAYSAEPVSLTMEVKYKNTKLYKTQIEVTYSERGNGVQMIFIEFQITPRSSYVCHLGLR